MVNPPSLASVRMSSLQSRQIFGIAPAVVALVVVAFATTAILLIIAVRVTQEENVRKNRPGV